MKTRAPVSFGSPSFGSPLLVSLLLACQSAPPGEVVERRAPETHRAMAGVRKVELDRGDAHHLVARRAPSGQLDVSCVKGQGAAEEAVSATTERSGR